MRQTIYKLFWAWDFDKEEKWLNEMAARGLSLVAVGFAKYTFEESLPGEYNIRLELLENLPSHPESQNYLRFLEETGVEYLGSITRWAYFRKKTQDGEFNLFYDNTSRIKHLNRMLVYFAIIALSDVAVVVTHFTLYFGSGCLANLVVGIVSLCLGVFIGFGYFHINNKKRRYKKEQVLFE